MPLKLRNYIKIVLTMLIFSMPVLAYSNAYACTNVADNISNGANATATGSTSNSTGTAGTSACGGTTSGITNGIGSLAKKAVDILSIIVGVVAIIMIIFGGFKYITSGGESGNVSGAKNTLIYAIVGLVVVALAQIIVHWVLNTASTVTISGIIHL